MNERTRQSSSESFRAWYQRNAQVYNLSRRKTYKENPELQEAARIRAAEYRKSVSNGRVAELRHGMYTTARVATILKISTQTLRNWEAKGLIPKSNHPGKHRLYTKAQVELLQSLMIASENKGIFEETRKHVFLEWESAGE